MVNHCRAIHFTEYNPRSHALNELASGDRGEFALMNGHEFGPIHEVPVFREHLSALFRFVFRTFSERKKNGKSQAKQSKQGKPHKIKD
jgi:hypothetical protein